MTANAVLLQKKYARVIELYAKKYSVSAESALSRFYKSFLYHQISEGISDLHCMSDDYLADELNEEWAESRHYRTCLGKVLTDAVVLRFISNEQLKLHLIQIGFLDNNKKERTNTGTGVIPVEISDCGLVEKSFSFPENCSFNGIHLIINDPNHQDRHSVTVLFDGTVNAQQLPFRIMIADSTKY